MCLYCNLIPISLFLCIKICKLLEITVKGCFYEGVSVANSNIMEDLGRVEYVLIEKSVILTEKSLTISKLVVGDLIYVKERQNNDDSIRQSADRKPMWQNQPNYTEDYDLLTFEHLQYSIINNEMPPEL